MADISKAGTYRLGDREVRRMGYGAMRLSGPGIYGPPNDLEQAVAVASGGSRKRRQPHRHERLITGRTSPTGSSARRSIPIRTI